MIHLEFIYLNNVIKGARNIIRSSKILSRGFFMLFRCDLYNFLFKENSRGENLRNWVFNKFQN